MTDNPSERNAESNLGDIDTKDNTNGERERLLNEPGDLSRQERLRILVLLRDVRERTHWHVLGLTGHADTAAIKKAYFTLSKAHHPDHYYRKTLGSFSNMIQQVFQGIKQAYDTLSNEESRRAYERQHPIPQRRRTPSTTRFGQGANAKKTEVPKGPSKEERARLEEHRQQILAERRQKREAPITERTEKAHTLFQAGIAALQEGKFLAADNKLQLAAAYAPNNKEYQLRYEEVHAEANQQRARAFVEAGDLELATGQSLRAALQYAQAADLTPHSANQHMAAAKCFHDAGEGGKAKTYVERAIKAAPRRLESRVLAAQIYMSLSDKMRAISHLEIAASIDKSDAFVKKTLKKLKKT